MSNRFADFFEMMEARIGKTSNLQKIQLLWSYAMGRLLIKASKKEFLMYGLYQRNCWGVNSIINEYRKMKFVNAVNDQKDSIIFTDKAAFLSRFSKYTNRDSIDLQKASLEEFEEFVSKHDRFFVKPMAGYFGIGARIEECSADCSVQELYKNLVSEGCVAEELIRQNEAFEQFNSSSVNTLRVVTFVRADGTPVLMPGAAIRLGRKGHNADNFHHQGIGAQIDIETGTVCTKGLDRDGKRYVCHPDSNAAIVGFQIPYWEEICSVVKKAALEVPSVRYVGWDVALTSDNKIILVEGNDKADPDLAQMSDGNGLWAVYKGYMEEVLQKKENKR